MNCVYKLVWNTAAKLWMVGSEHASGQGKKGRATRAVGALSIAPLLFTGAMLNSSTAYADCTVTGSSMACSGNIGSTTIALDGIDSVDYTDGRNPTVKLVAGGNDSAAKTVTFDGDSSLNTLALGATADVLNLNGGQIANVNAGGGGDTIRVQGAGIGRLEMGDVAGAANTLLISSGSVDRITAGSGGGPSQIGVTGGTVGDIQLGSVTGGNTVQLNGGTVSTVSGSRGNDTIVLDGASMPGQGAWYGTGAIFGSAGDNRISILSGDVVDVVGGTGTDTIDVHGGTISGVLMGGDGNDVITIHGDNATIASVAGDFYYDPGSQGPNSLLYHDVLNLDHVTDSIPVNPLSATTVGSDMSEDYQGAAAGFGFEEINLQNGSDLTLHNDLWQAGRAQDPMLSVDGSSTLRVAGSQTIHGSLNNNGLVNIGSQDGSIGSVLTIDGNLTGNGRFGMHTDLAAGQGDLLTVRGTAEGTHTLLVADSGKEPATSGGELKVVETGGGSGTFELSGGYVDAGAYRYTLEQRDADWYLANPAVDPIEPVDPDSPDDSGDSGGGKVDPSPDNYSKGTNAAVANQIAYSTLWAAELDTLVQRLGDMRRNDSRGGLWVRNLSRDNEIDTGSTRRFDQNVQGFELGADKVIAVESGRWVLGGMVGQATADNDFGEGAKGEIDSLTLGGYATYLSDSGLYIDSVLKYNKFDTDTKYSNNLGERVKGSQDTHGFGASVEVGKQYQLDSGWFVEPQAQLSAMHVKGDSYKQSNDLRVESDDLDSLLSRVGVRAGRDFKLQNGAPMTIYAKASYITEHGDDSQVNVNGHDFDAKLPGSRTEVGAGLNLAASQSSNVYMDVSYAKGDDLETPWALNVGYRYDW